MKKTANKWKNQIKKYQIQFLLFLRVGCSTDEHYLYFVNFFSSLYRIYSMSTIIICICFSSTLNIFRKIFFVVVVVCECALEFLTANKSLFENIENSFIEWRISAFKYYKESCAIFQILILVFDPFYYGFQSKLIETCAKELAHK